MLPNTFIIGVPKAGTTSLHDYLSQHPQIHTAKFYKDYHFLSSIDEKPNFEHIENIFKKDYKNQKIIIDTGVNYFYSKKTIDLIANFFPDSKLIICLRNPTKRAISEYNFNYKKGKRNVSTEKLIDYGFDNIKIEMKEEIKNGFYSENLKYIFEKIKRNNVHVLIYETFFSKQFDEEWARLMIFLEISSSFFPDQKLLNYTGKPIFLFLNKLVMRKNLLKKILFIHYWPIGIRSKLSRLIININTKKDDKSKIDSIKNFLDHIYAEEIKTIYQMEVVNKPIDWIKNK